VIVTSVQPGMVYFNC